MSNGSSEGRGKWQVSAVEKEGVEDEVLDLFKQGYSLKKISEKLQGKGVQITPTSIGRWLKRSRKQFKENTDIQTREKFETMVINYRSELNEILDEVKTMKSQARFEGDLQIYDKLVGRLYQGLELLAKLTGDYKTSNTVDITLVINDITQKTFEKYKENRSFVEQSNIIDVEAEILESDNLLKENLK